jgi:hypothetical protein
METQAIFENAHAGRYIGTLCKHFGHKVPTGHTGGTGWIDLPFGRCDLVASDTELRLTVSAKSPPEVSKVQQVITSHLERFAFRENPNLDWAVPTAATQTNSTHVEKVDL